MTCPICDQKPANCDCTESERRQHSEIEDLEEEIERLRAERRWIPVGERLPDIDPESMLLVCVQCEDGSRSVDVARWRLDADGRPSWGDICGSNQTIYGWSNLVVVAWMPMPEPPEVT